MKFKILKVLIICWNSSGSEGQKTMTSTVPERRCLCVSEQSKVSGPTQRPSPFQRRSSCGYQKLLACASASTVTTCLLSGSLFSSFTQRRLSEAPDAGNLARHQPFPSHLPHLLALLSHASPTLPLPVTLAGPLRWRGPGQQAKPGE